MESTPFFQICPSELTITNFSPFEEEATVEQDSVAAFVSINHVAPELLLLYISPAYPTATNFVPVLSDATDVHIPLIGEPLLKTHVH